MGARKGRRMKGIGRQATRDARRGRGTAATTSTSSGPVAPAHAVEALTAPVETVLTTARRGDGLPARRSPIPSRNKTVRRRVRELVDSLGFTPSKGDVFALVRWATLFEVWRVIADKLSLSSGERLNAVILPSIFEAICLNGEQEVWRGDVR